jgi:hypothetical protein
MGLATVLALGTFMAAMFRKERRLAAAVARAERKS